MGWGRDVGQTPRCLVGVSVGPCPSPDWSLLGDPSWFSRIPDSRTVRRDGVTVTSATVPRVGATVGRGSRPEHGNTGPTDLDGRHPG